MLKGVLRRADILKCTFLISLVLTSLHVLLQCVSSSLPQIDVRNSRIIQNLYVCLLPFHLNLLLFSRVNVTLVELLFTWMEGITTDHRRQQDRDRQHHPPRHPRRLHPRLHAATRDLLARRCHRVFTAA